jgi:hypothetical protein
MKPAAPAATVNRSMDINRAAPAIASGQAFIDARSEASSSARSS